MRKTFTRFRRALMVVPIIALGISACSISQQQEIELGQQYAAEINRQLPIVDDPVVNRYINLLGN